MIRFRGWIRIISNQRNTCTFMGCRCLLMLRLLLLGNKLD